MDKNKINIINKLAKKAKTVGLTSEERAEQQILRQEYIQSFKNNLKNTLDNVVYIENDGTKRNIVKKDKKDAPRN